MRHTLLRLLACALILAPALAAAVAPEEYAARRAALARQIGPDAMLILMSPPDSVRNGDVSWPFRQEDSILYLTGLSEPDTTLVLVPGEQDHREIVFSRDSDPSQELWTGRIPGAYEVSQSSGVAEVASAAGFDNFIRAAMEGRPWGKPSTYRSFGSPGLPAWRQKVREGKATVWLIMESRGFGGEASAEQQFVEKLRRSYPELQFRDAFRCWSRCAW